MTQSTCQRIPEHLLKYIVTQDYERYTPEDQAVWRYLLRQLRDFLSSNAHECYRDGLKKTGVSIERIPRIDEIDAHLESFGWGAVPVSGFIPPAAFMEFQSLGILPIASDMRSLDHLLYTPAPDIVHEAAGHAPILIHPDFANYLRRYADVARHAIVYREDLDQYEAIRILSDVKENPLSTAQDIQQAERRLADANARIRHVSEAALLSRMNWWTAEYGLIGDINKPKIFGAGLLSSLGESRWCLDPKVKKIPLDIHCVDFTYDITEPQPQLFVTPDFAALNRVLDELAERLAYKRGGLYGLHRAVEAETTNTVQLDSDLQISGCLNDVMTTQVDGSELPIYLKFSGPVQLSVGRRELPNQGVDHHPHGFSSPLGRLKQTNKSLSDMSDQELSALGIARGKQVQLTFNSGVVVKGQVTQWLRNKSKLILLSFVDCTVTLGTQILFEPGWGTFDMAIGESVTSVFAGPADRHTFGETRDFAAKRVPRRSFSPEQEANFKMFSELRRLRERAVDNKQTAPGLFADLLQRYLKIHSDNWLMGIELYELAQQIPIDKTTLDLLKNSIQPDRFSSEHTRRCIQDGLRLATQIQ